MITVALISTDEKIIAATAVALSHAATPHALTSQRTLPPADTAAPIILLDGAMDDPDDPSPALAAWLAALPVESVLIWLMPLAGVNELPNTAVRQQNTLTTDLLDADHLLPLLNLVHDVTQSQKAAVALANSEAYLRSVWKYVSDALVLSDEHGRVIDANNAYLTLYGYERHEVIDQNFALIFPSEVREQANRDYQAVFHAPHQPDIFENTIRRSDGQTRMVETRINFITDDGGKRLAMLSSIRDVTARKQAEMALREREALLSSILNAVPGILGIVNIPQQQIRFINHRPDIFDMGDVGLDIASLSEILLPENLQAVLTYFEQLEHVGEQAVRTITLRAQNAAGGYQHLQGWHTPLTVDDHGRVQEIVFIVMDVTAQEETQQRLQHTQRRQQAMLKALPDMMFRVTRAGRVIDFQAPDAQELVIDPDEVIGADLTEIMSPQVVQIMLDNMQKTLETGQLTKIEYPLLVQKGVEEYEARLVPSGPDEVLAVVRNITDQKRTQSELQMQIVQLQEARARLVHSEKLAAIGELVAGVAHELNNPVTTLVLNAELLQRFQGSLANPKLDILLSNIIQQALQSGNIVRGLLDFARQRPPERLPTQLNDLLASTLNLMAYELRTRGFTVNRDLDPALPQVVVDGQQIQQVLVNLLNNAMQAMRPDQKGKQIWLQSYCDEKHGRVCLSVRDNGPGILPEVQKRIFEPFFTTKSAGHGTGLGLSLCHSIVHEHQGHLWVESTPHTGTTFFIAFPPASSATAQAPEPLTSLPSTERKPLPGQMVRILVVDDEPSILEACRFILSDYYEVDTASSGSEALHYMAHVRYDLMVSGIFMPEMNGLDLYRHLHEHPTHQPYHLLFMTGDVLDTYTQAFLEQVDVPLLHKPFTVDELHTAVANLLHEP